MRMTNNKLKTQKKQIFGVTILIITAVIWGFAFVAQRKGGDAMPPMMFNAARSFIAFIALVVLMPVLDMLTGERPSIWGTAPKTNGGLRTLMFGGLWCGIMLSVSSLLQQVGIKYTEVSKAGFLTALYIVFVPLLGIFLKRRATPKQWINAIIALVGTYMLCVTGNICPSVGDLLVLACAICFTGHILVIDHFAPLTDCVRMACIQFLITGIVSLIAGCICECLPTWPQIQEAAIPILYCGLLSSAAAYTLQIIGQKHVHPAVASLILSLESVFSAIGGWLLLHERLNTFQLTGCAIIFLSVILSQLPDKSGKLQQERQ